MSSLVWPEPLIMYILFSSVNGNFRWLTRAVWSRVIDCWPAKPLAFPICHLHKSCKILPVINIAEVLFPDVIQGIAHLLRCNFCVKGSIGRIQHSSNLLIMNVTHP